MSNLALRIITGIFLVIILVGSTLQGGILLFSLILFLSVVGVYEFYKIMKNLEYKPNLLLGILFAIVLVLINYLGYNRYEGNVIILFSTILMFIMTFKEKLDINTVFLQVFTLIYIPLSFSRILLLAESNLVWLVYICAWGTDTFAYIAGSLFGKHKLAEKVSPKKTIEGSIGGILGAVILTLLFAYFMKLDNYIILVLGAVVGSIMAQLGDLCASKFKRLSGAKDYGYVFLGHGGVLDRFDSVLFTAPYIYLIFLMS
ncbi:phosphatidate cytidylyltransferase [Lagierella sp.]|uniref:phosphatidate cytidylyltransferase n=1 Tax=Lagierella sp. TaxID=2849657 RepID=UPI0026118DB2|nr:phosphatidate cytidylyltransferase [Lagierella sp.]